MSAASGTTGTSNPRSERRHLGWIGVAALWVAFAFLPAIVDNVVHGNFDNYFPDIARATSLLPGRVTEFVLIVVVISALRWWPVVWRERLRARAWVWVVVVVPLAMSLWFIDRDNVAASGWALALGVLAISLLIGFSEELFFRGVILTAMRDRYGREWLAALITTVIFGLSHFSGGVPNILSTLVTGFLFYWMRRVSGGILVPALVHSLYDFAIYTSYTGPHPADTDSLSLSVFLVGALLSIVLLALHRYAAPAGTTPFTPDVGVEGS
ncbi:CPBP family intramembrane glutamic endopeptidase [Longivirga aurantiaca]|uniref:CPBP family intramembrane glutamic endopeptidase n=1 Tax=Longivirga aurantiaca TaxID=1837743 RepID=A0ABW1SWN4_9ACTN